MGGASFADINRDLFCTFVLFCGFPGLFTYLPCKVYIFVKHTRQLINIHMHLYKHVSMYVCIYIYTYIYSYINMYMVWGGGVNMLVRVGA